ncbi:HAD-IA family hydrolase [Streptomyces xiaopingdaonensis]|uniref:HAD-IA family hydrolase n=1 Tax=Streptomyces xiaopingdaonensis TaxID=1565415 RepID=UPI0002D2C60D|nr:HAD-IA family hydrolase [Streptomyces xiaopingdaonensis]
MTTEATPLTLPFHGVLLDMDGTLVNSDAVVERCWRRWADEQGIDPATVLRIAHGRQSHDTMAELLPERAPADNAADNARMSRWERADTDGVVEVPGARALLDALAAQRVPHALVTSADVPLSTVRMAAAGLPYPAIHVTAESVSAGKPDPEGFLKGAAELGLAPADCLVLEDSAAGCAAARAAGMRVLGVGPRAAAHLPDAHTADLTGIRVESGPDGVAAVHISAGRP